MTPTETETASEVIHDPVHRVRYSFRRHGEDMTVDCWVEPGGGLPEHLHPRQEEHWSVVEGQIRFGLESKKRVIGPEDGVMEVKPGMKHSLASSSDEVAHCRCVVMPARELEAFLTDSAAAAREGLFMKGGIPKSLRGARWAATFLKQHREDVVMTFPPQFVQSAMIALLGR